MAARTPVHLGRPGYFAAGTLLPDPDRPLRADPPTFAHRYRAGRFCRLSLVAGRRYGAVAGTLRTEGVKSVIPDFASAGSAGDADYFAAVITILVRSLRI